MAYRFNLLNTEVNRPIKSASPKKEKQESQKTQHPLPDELSFDSDKLNSLSRSICAIHPDDFPGLIIVANAADTKEKGVVALHLAKSIAHMPGQSVFLIDADFSSPSVHAACAMPLSPGLGEYLSDENPLASLIRRTGLDGLQVLTAGKSIGRASSLLSSEKMNRFVGELKTKCPGLVLMINMDVAVLSDVAPQFVDQADGVVLALDEAFLPTPFQTRPIDVPKNARLLGVIRKQGERSSEDHDTQAFNPDDTAVSFVRPDSINPAPVADSPLVTLNQPVSFETEQFNKLTANMIQSDILNRSRVFMFTSPSSGDGKSYVSCNAAVSLARNTGKQVLIVDCDLRAPSVHHFFNLANTSGLGAFLKGDIDTLSQCIQKTGVENLAVLTAGRACSHPLTRLSSDRMIRLIDGIKKRFKDMIIILDAAPPSLMAEGHVVSKLAETIILVASHHQTDKADMKQLAEMFDREKVYGVIYNHYTRKKSLFSIYKYYNRYKKAA